MSKVFLFFNGYYHEEDFDTCVDMMDDDIRERVEDELPPCSDQEFLDRYCQLYEEEFGDEFQV